MSCSALSGDPAAVTLVTTQFFQPMTLGKDLRAQEQILTSQTGSPTTKVASIGQKTFKIVLKISRPALSGDLTGVK